MKLFFAVALFVVAHSAHAAAVAMRPPAGITGNPAMSSGWSTASNFVGSFSAASFSGGFTTNVAGTAVTMPASMRLAANAGQFAVAAVRLTPAALIGPAVLAWLMSAGLEWIDGEWKKKSATGANSDSNAPCSYQGEASNCGIVGVVGGYAYCTDGQFKGKWTISYTSPGPSWVVNNNCTLKSGNTYYKTEGGYFPKLYLLPDAVPAYVPATDADFAPLQTAALPDAVANELAPKGVALPVENPEFNPKYKDVPLGQPTLDPVTNERYQDKARVSPNSDGKTADVQPFKQKVDANGDPIVDPSTGEPKPDTQDQDFCKQNPDSIACLEPGETDDSDLENRQQGGLVNPVSVGGGGSCPQPKTIPLPGGGSTQFSYQPICDGANMIRPIVLAIAWLLAGYIVVGAMRNE